MVSAAARAFAWLGPGLNWRAIQAPPLGFRWVAALCLMAVMATGGASRPMVAMTLALAAVFVLLPEPGAGLSRRPFVVVGSLVLAGWGFLCSLNEWHANDARDAAKLAASLPFWLLAALAAGLAVPAVRGRRWPVLALASIALLPVLSFVLPAGSLWIIATLLMVLTGVLMVLPAFKGDGGSPRLGALLISLVVVMRFINSEMSLTVKDLGFIIAGTGFIAFNILLARRSRRPEQS